MDPKLGPGTERENFPVLCSPIQLSHLAPVQIAEHVKDRGSGTPGTMQNSARGNLLIHR